MQQTKFDIFISYKRKSLPTANNLYYRLTTRGYSTFFDLEEMGRDNFNEQLLNYIENSKDVFVILEEGSLDACKKTDWEKDWFCHEIAYALEKKKNIIPILIGGYQMPSDEFFPDKLKELSLKNAPEFNFSFFEAYLDKLIEKKYLLSQPNQQEKTTSVFKFYSNENCQVYKEGKLVCSLEGMSDEPYYLPVPRKGDYRFKVVNNASHEIRIQNAFIDLGEEKNVEITWNNRKRVKSPFQGNRKGWNIALGVVSVMVAMSLRIVLWQIISDINENGEGTHEQLSYDSQVEIENDCESKVKNETENHSKGENDESVILLTSGDFVDLGLSVNWASHNVGATTPEGSGGYYAWGETKEKDEYTLDTYAYTFSEYGYTTIKRIASDISGTKYDAAKTLLAGNYRIPTRNEMKELILGCDWDYGMINGVSGMVVTGKNGNCIFIPAVGIKENITTSRTSYYWTSTAGEYGTPYCLHISAYPIEAKYDLINYISVEYGLPIRPVITK